MKKFFLPVAVVIMAAGAAFGTQLAKNSAPVNGHRIGNIGEAPCVDVTQVCSDIPGDACLWSVDESTPLYQLDGTMCGEELFKPQ